MSVAYLSACCGGSNNGATNSFTTAVTVLAVPDGSTLCVAATANNGGAGQLGVTYACSDNASGGTNTYVPGPVLTGQGSGGFFGFDLSSFVCKVTHGSPTVITVTQTGGGAFNFNSIGIDCFSGVLATTIIDGNNAQYQAAPGTGTDAVTSGTFTAANPSDLIWSASIPGAGITVNPGTGFTAGLVRGAANNTGGFATEYQLVGSSGSNAGTWTYGTAAASITAAFALQGPATVFSDTIVGCDLALMARSGNEQRVTDWL